MKKIMHILTTFFLLLPSVVWATAQIPDSLIYKGEKLYIFSNPLESYFNADNPRPRDIFKFSCTACWRGYVATWKIEDGELFLQKIVEGTCSSKAKEIRLSHIFPDQKGPIRASWFSGTLRIPQGKQMLYVHMGYGSVYEQEIILVIEKGKLVKEELQDNRKKKLPTGDEKTQEELQKLKEWEDSKKPKK
jgi:hypothetical protein